MLEIATLLDVIGERLRAVPPTPFPGPSRREAFPFDLEQAVGELIAPHLPLPTMRVFGGHHFNLHPTSLVSPLLVRARDNGGEEAARWLHKVCSVETADVRVVAELHGLAISGRIELPGRVWGAAPSSAPRSPRIADLDAVETLREAERRALAPPVAVLWTELEGMRWSDEPRGDNAFGQAAQALQRTALALTLLPGQAPLLIRIWREFCDPDLEDAVSGEGWAPALEDGAALPDPPPTVMQEHLAPAIAYCKASRQIRHAMIMPISRLGLARRRRGIGNQAVEICTALESIFGDNQTQTEIRYRLALRAALYLGTTFAERKDIRRRVGDLYSVRSGAVHRGAAGSPENAGAVSFGMELAVRGLLKILADRQWPNWPAMELAPPPLSEPES